MLVLSQSMSINQDLPGLKDSTDKPDRIDIDFCNWHIAFEYGSVTRVLNVYQVIEISNKKG